MKKLVSSLLSFTMLSIAIHAFGQIADSSASNYLFYTPLARIS